MQTQKESQKVRKWGLVGESGGPVVAESGPVCHCSGWGARASLLAREVSACARPAPAAPGAVGV